MKISERIDLAADRVLEGESYFRYCPRDESGRCLPSGVTSAGKASAAYRSGVDRAFSGMPAALQDRLEASGLQVVITKPNAAIPNPIRDRIDQALAPLGVRFATSSGSFYSPSTHVLVLRSSYSGIPAEEAQDGHYTTLHEAGHAIDRALAVDGRLTPSRDSERMRLSASLEFMAAYTSDVRAYAERDR